MTTILVAAALATIAIAATAVVSLRRRRRVSWSKAARHARSSQHLVPSQEGSPPLLLPETGCIGLAPDPSSLARYRSALLPVVASDHQLIGVSGSRSADGSGATAAGLAHAAASMGARTVLISGQVDLMGLAAEELAAGLHATIWLDKAISEVIIPIETVNGTLHYVPPGPLDREGGLLAHAEDVMAGIAELTSTDVVIVELPPILDDVVAVSIARYLDGVILSSIAGRTTRRDVDAACSRLDACGIEVLGEVIHERTVPRPIFVAAPRPSVPPALDPVLGPFDGRS